jgi:ketosteroid isomerase-like protein
VVPGPLPVETIERLRVSEQNVGIVRWLYDMLNVGGAEAVRGLLDPDVVFKEPPEQPGATAFHGMDAAIEGWEGARERA